MAVPDSFAVWQPEFCLHQYCRVCLCCQHGRLPSLVCVCVCVPSAWTCTVCDSSSMITSGCKIALWGNQYVWIWVQPHAHTHKPTHTTRSRSVSLFVAPPSFLSYKTPAFGAAARGFADFHPRGRHRQPGARPSSRRHHPHRLHHHWSPQTAQHNKQTNMAPFEKSMELMPFKQRKCLGKSYV